MALISSLTLFSFLAIILTLAQAQSELILTVVNNCPFTIWPAVLPNHGFPVLEKGGFPLSSLTHRSFPVPNTHWAGRVWARTGCTYSNGKFSCATGDCGGRIECNGLGGQVPATLAQFSIHHGNRDHSAYGVSLVDGFNLPMTITPHEGKGVCPVVGCKANLLQNCPKPLEFRGLHGNGPIVGCKSGCLAFNTDEFCCRNQYNSAKTCHGNTYSQYFKHACPATFTYAHDTSLMHDCAAPRELKVILCH